MSVKVLVGFDGSPAASAAIEAGAQLFPGARAWIVHLWTPPFASDSLRARLWAGSARIEEFVAAIEREGVSEAERLANTGVVLAKAAGWDAEPLVVRSYGGDGLRFTELADKVDADVVVVGSRGLGGAKAILGSVSDMVVHYTSRPVLVVPHPLLTAEHTALAEGPVVVGFDGSAGAQAALAAAQRFFPDRRRLLVGVDDGQAPSDASIGDTPIARFPMPKGHVGTGRAVAAGLAEYASQEAAAVVVVGSRGRSAVREILLGSVAMATLHHAHRPVLVVSTEDVS